MTLVLNKHSILGPNSRILVQGKGGELIEHAIGDDCSYLGYMEEDPSITVSALLTPQGLVATLIRPNKPNVYIETEGENELHTVRTQATDEDPTPDPLSVLHEEPVNLEAKAAAVDLKKKSTAEQIAPASFAQKNAGATLPPSRVMQVYEYEIGVEIGSRAFNSETYDSDMTRAMNSAMTTAINMDAAYLFCTGLKHRVGTVIIRTDDATDPLRSIVNSGSATGAVSGLNAFRDYWNRNPQEVGTTHDLAVYHIGGGDIPTGLAYPNSVGTSNRYATCKTKDPFVWADHLLEHEFGHIWNLAHVPRSFQESSANSYEARPRSNSNSAGGLDSFFTVMRGGSRNINRLSSGEALRVYAAALNKRQFGDLVTNPGPIAPYGLADNFQATGSPVRLDVVANDYDANNDVLNLRLRDTVSFQGATISVSSGTGPGGRDEILYTPPANYTGRDFFHYDVVDSSNRSSFGAVYVENIGPRTVDTNRDSFFYDLGTPTSPLFNQNSDPYERISELTSGDLGFTTSGPNAVESRNRSVSGVNDLNRDHIRMRSTSRFFHKLRPGVYEILFTIGDASEATAPIRFTFEGGPQTLTTNSQSSSQFANYTANDVTVDDGELDIDIENLGFTANISRIVIRYRGALPTDSDSDGIIDPWELSFFGNLTTTSGDPDEDFDNDGLSDRLEYENNSNPTLADTDGDTVTDGDEVNRYGTEPDRKDSDSDGFDDRSEIVYRSDPNLASSAPTIPGLVAYYSFDDGGGDTAQNHVAGGADAVQNSGSANLIGWATSGQVIGSGCLDLNGRASLLTVDPLPSDTQAFTFSLWFNPDENPAYQGIFAGRNSPGNWGINLEGTHADLRFVVSDGGSNGIDTANGSILASGGWYHMAITWESDGASATGKVYLNGVLIQTTTNVRLNYTGPTLGYFIGDDPCCPNRRFNGQIDDLAVYSRALTPEELGVIYSQGSTLGQSIVASIAPSMNRSRPRSLSIDQSTDDLSFQFPTEDDTIYRVYHSFNLSTWELLKTVVGDGNSYLFNHEGGADLSPAQFYIVE